MTCIGYKSHLVINSAFLSKEDLNLPLSNPQARLFKNTSIKNEDIFILAVYHASCDE